MGEPSARKNLTLADEEDPQRVIAPFFIKEMTGEPLNEQQQKMAHRFDSGWREGAREVMQPRKLIMKTLVPTFMRNWILATFKKVVCF